VQFPVNLELAGKRCLLVGGGRIALRKAEQLLTCGAHLTVVAPDVHEGFSSLPVVIERRPYRAGDVAGHRLVITATGDAVVDQQIHDEAEALGIWVNSADDPDRCTFTLPAVVRRGDLMITVSTAGSSPALSSWMRRRLEQLIGDEYAAITDELSARRRAIHSDGVSTETIDWQPIITDVLRAHGVGESFAAGTCPCVVSTPVAVTA